MLGAGAVGGVLGSVLTRRIAARTGVGRAYLIGCIVYPVPVLLIPLAAGPHLLILGMLFAAEFVAGFGVMILDISIGHDHGGRGARPAPVPGQRRLHGHELRHPPGRVAARAGGAAGALLGLHPALWIAAAGGTLGFLFLPSPSPMPRFRLAGPGGP